MRAATLTLLTLALPAAVSAHGFVHKVWIGSKTFLGNTPQAEPTASIVRQISEVDPVKGATNPDVNCGHSAQLAEDIADANPGDELGFLWTGGDLSKWPHNVGPMLTYMTACDGDCASFDTSQAKWFKIDQVGRIPGDKDGNWVQSKIFANPVPANVTLPSNIAPGNYIIRHEIIALHLANEKGGAEFYPSCSQIRVGGSGTGKPTSDELVLLPGAYSDNDPGIFVPKIFDDVTADYDFPGPPVAAFVGAGGSGNGGAASSGSKTTSAASSSSTGSSKGSKSGKSCKLRRATPSSASSKKKRAVVPRPHKVSRIMRELSLGLSGRR